MPTKSSRKSRGGRRRSKEEEEDVEMNDEEEEAEAGDEGPVEHAETDEDDYESDEEEMEEEKAEAKKKAKSKAETSEEKRRRGGRSSGGGRGGSSSGGPGEDDDGDSNDDRRKKKKSGRRKRMALMSESGQTDEDRRLLRRELRELQGDLVGAKGDLLEDPSKVEAFDDVRGRSNKMWENVAHTREAVLDADNLDLMATRAGRQADRLIQVPRYDAARFCKALRSKLSTSASSGRRRSSSSYFDWLKLGRASGACYCSVPSRVSFLNGPLQVEHVVKERKKPERRKRAVEEEEGEEERPDEVDQRKGSADKEGGGDKLSAVEKNIKVVNKRLNKRCQEELAATTERAESMIAEKGDDWDDDTKRRLRKKARKHGAEVDAVKYLFNPKSFTQTVENIFHFSFLVKKGSAGIGIRSEKESEQYGGAGPGPVVRVTSNPNEAPTPRQAIVSLNMQDWRDLCQAYSVKEGDIPHRGRGGGGSNVTASAEKQPSSSKK